MRETITLYVLLKCWFEGDSCLVDDSFVKVSDDYQKLLRSVPKGKTVYGPGEYIPYEGKYGDDERYRIIKREI